MLIKASLLIRSAKKYLNNNFTKLNYSQASKMEYTEMVDLIKSSIPPLNRQNHKGQSGRIGIVGGSLEYTGAPYFAGISALKVGADLVHIFCTTAAAGVIKSYSPELIVHPLLDTPNGVPNIIPWLKNLHAIVIGPGLGRNVVTLNVVSELLKIICEMQIPLVIDADGLFLITENPELIFNFASPVILTPNKIEYQRLVAKLNKTDIIHCLGRNVTILKKGEMDTLYSVSEKVQWQSNTGGSGRRCGGQGDLLSGSIATFLHWTLEQRGNPPKDIYLAPSISCYAASVLIRLCNEKAFKVKGRSMLATDMIDYIHESFEELFGEPIIPDEYR